MRITFHGAARTVTGSQHLLETRGARLLLDCGLFQGRRSLARQMNSEFHFEPGELDGVLLSHAHMDHAGKLPSLVKKGFTGPIHCTPATRDITALLLRDSAHIQVEDAAYLNRKKRRRGEPPIEPLYDLDDAERAIKHLAPAPYDKPFEPVRGAEVTFRDAGHVLGSAIVQVVARENGQARKLVFTGDLGRRGMPILRDPAVVTDINVLITESTYGNKVHPDASGMRECLGEIIARVAARRGKVIIPSFSFGRTQRIVYFLHELAAEGRFADVPVFVDSPLSSRITKVYRRHSECYDDDAWRLLDRGNDPFAFGPLRYVESVDESKELNVRPGPLVVISASGMCEGGRVLHHLKHAVADPANCIVIVGFQAAHTLGRRIVERVSPLRILDDWFELRAEVVVLNGLSSHADQADFIHWFGATGDHYDHVFMVHGDEERCQGLADVVRPYCTGETHVPALYDAFDV